MCPVGIIVCYDKYSLCSSSRNFENFVNALPLVIDATKTFDTDNGKHLFILAIHPIKDTSEDFQQAATEQYDARISKFTRGGPSLQVIFLLSIERCCAFENSHL